MKILKEKDEKEILYQLREQQDLIEKIRKYLGAQEHNHEISVDLLTLARSNTRALTTLLWDVHEKVKTVNVQIRDLINKRILIDNGNIKEDKILHITDNFLCLMKDGRWVEGHKLVILDVINDDAKTEEETKA